MQRDRTERDAVVAVTTHQLGGEVLGLRRAAAVAAGEHPAASPAHRRHLTAPSVDAVGVGRQLVEHPYQLADVLAAGGQRGRHASTGTGTEPATWAYTSRVERATRRQSYRARARRTPARPNSARRVGSASSDVSASATRSGRRAGTCTPVIPS